MREHIIENQELIFVILMIFVIMGTYYYYLFREYSKTEEALKRNKLVPNVQIIGNLLVIINVKI